MKFSLVQMIAPFLLVLSFQVVAISGQQYCSSLKALTCLSINGIDCALSCDNNEIDVLENFVAIADDCTGHDDFCALATCCQPCQADIVAYKNCLFQQCDSTTCNGIVPTAPSPSEPIMLFPPVNLSFPELPDLCGSESQSLYQCVMANGLACADACSAVDMNSDDPSCDAIQGFCAIKSCCPSCQNEVSSFVDCVSNTLSCDADCSKVSVQPMAPSPPTPTLNIPPAIFDTDELIRCQSLVNNWLICVSSNFDSCQACGEPSSEFIDLASCQNIDSFCNILTCCDSCSNQGKAAGSCTANVFQCQENCGDYSPFEPSSFSIPDFSLPPILASFQPILAPAISPAIPKDSELNVTKAPTPLATVPVSGKSVAPVIVNSSSISPNSVAPVFNVSTVPVTVAPIDATSSGPITTAPVAVTAAPIDATSSGPVTTAPVAVTPAPVSTAPVSNASSTPTSKPSANNATDSPNGSSIASFSSVHFIVTFVLLAVTIATL